jgi:HPt (histidine-containing phosphotransfer) domain-containing protein
MTPALDSPDSLDPAPERASRGALPDRDALLRSVEGDAALLERMARIFREQSRRLIEELKVAIEQGDASGVNEAAHALKGSLAYWCQGEAFEIARRLEAKGRTGDLDGAREDGERLAVEYGRLEKELTTVLRLTLDEEEPTCLHEPS